MSQPSICMSLAALLFLLCPYAAFAEDVPSPDKSQYNLFNPVPDDLLRTFTSDRPGKSSSATTVDAGHFQYEGDIVNWSYDRYNADHTTTSSITGINPFLKLGLTQNIDIEFVPQIINATHVTDRTTNTHNSAFGFGDLYTYMKFNLLGNEGGTFQLAIAPYVKAPTANQHIGNGHWEGGGYVPLNINLPDDWTVTLETQLDILENADLSGLHTNYQNLINVDHPIYGPLSGEVEFWTDVNTDKNSPTQYTFDLALVWLAMKDLQFDCGTNIGLNKAAPDIQLYTGISQRF